MSTFHLKISTPDGLLFDGEVERIRARMIDGDVCLLAHHADYVSAVGAGEAAGTEVCAAVQAVSASRSTAVSSAAACLRWVMGSASLVMVFSQTFYIKIRRNTTLGCKIQM